MTMNIAVAHEHHPARGGGEIVAEALARTFNAPLYTGYLTDEGTPDDPGLDIHDLWGDTRAGPLLKREYPFKYMVRDLFYTFAWEHAPLHDHDVIIQSGNNPGWYVPRDDQVIVKYVHSTPRTPYDLFHTHAKSIPARLYSKVARTLYQQNLSYPELYLANSELVARRITQYWNIPEDNVRVVHPPVPTSDYTPRAGGDYYLALSRLTQEKRFDHIINAFRQNPSLQLKIAGDGPERQTLEAQASDLENVEFHGYVPEPEKRSLLEGANALVFAAKNEDFGIVPIEAMAAGTPVIGVRDGYTQHQIKNGKNGLLFSPEGGHLRETIRQFEHSGVSWSPSELHSFADRNFSTDRFNREITAAVETAIERAHITPDWKQDDDTPTPDPVEPALTDGSGRGDTQ